MTAEDDTTTSQWVSPPPEESLQVRLAPSCQCFGCGCQNAMGLQLKSFERDGKLWARFQPRPHHQAFPGMLNGGIIGTLLDCHSNWTAAYSLMKQADLQRPPCTVTADFHVKLKAPTPLAEEVELWAEATLIESPRVKVEARLLSRGKLCATCSGLFVAVKPGHPAYHGW